VIYSVHNPFTGKFSYYEAKPDVAINDDLPTPRWGSDVTTKIGVPATLAARPLPSGAVPAGEGDLPVGLISSGEAGQWVGTKKGALPSGLGAIDTASKALPLFFIAGAGVSLIFAMKRQQGGWPFLGAAAAMLIGAVWASGRA